MNKAAPGLQCVPSEIVTRLRFKTKAKDIATRYCLQGQSVLPRRHRVAPSEVRLISRLAAALFTLTASTSVPCPIKENTRRDVMPLFRLCIPGLQRPCVSRLVNLNNNPAAAPGGHLCQLTGRQGSLFPPRGDQESCSQGIKGQDFAA